MKWKTVGKWIKDNAGSGTALVGSLLSGNVPGAIAAGVSLVSSATGKDTPEEALIQLQNDPEALVKLKELYYKNEEDIRSHIEKMVELELTDIQDARSMYEHNNKMADVIAKKIINQNHLLVASLIIANGLTLYFVKETALAVAITNLISASIGYLWNERQQVVGFFYGSSLGSKMKDKVKEMSEKFNK